MEGWELRVGEGPWAGVGWRARGRKSHASEGETA